MTLAESADFITLKLSDTDAASITACKSFLNRRYKMIWDGAIWTETLGVLQPAVLAGDAIVTLSGVPEITFFHSASIPSTKIDFPVAVKFTVTGQDDGRELIGQEWMTFFQLDPNIWNTITSRRTTPSNFVNLPKDGSGNARVKLLNIPDAAGTLFVLGKLNFVTLGDTDTPCLHGVDNALLCFAEGDMLERGRQYGKAQAKYAEGASHIQTMRDIEKGQQQSMSRIIPWVGDSYQYWDD